MYKSHYSEIYRNTQSVVRLGAPLETVRKKPSMILDPNSFSHSERYKLSIGAVVPRPIAWVSTMDGAGNLNLAPFSYFTCAATDPLTVIFCPQIDRGTGRKKDTLQNIEEVPEFVVNFTNEATAEAMNLSATILPRGESEFAWAGVTPAPSSTIRVPRVAEAPIAFECTLQQIVTINDRPGGGAAVFGEVQAIYIDDAIYDAERNYVLLDKYKPIGRLSGNGYTRVTDTFSMARVPPPATE